MLRDIAEQFQRWLKEWSEKRDIPVMEAPQGRRDDFVDPYFKGADPDAVVVVREPARIMTAIGDGKTNRWHLQIATAGSSNTISTSTTGRGGRCSSASVPICRFPPASASISIIGLANRMREEAAKKILCMGLFSKNLMGPCLRRQHNGRVSSLLLAFNAPTT